MSRPLILAPATVTQQPKQYGGVSAGIRPALILLGSAPALNLANNKPFTRYNWTLADGVDVDGNIVQGTGYTTSICDPAGSTNGSSFVCIIRFKNTTSHNGGHLMTGKTSSQVANGFMASIKSNPDTLELNGGDAATFGNLSVIGLGAADGKYRTLVVQFLGATASAAYNGRYIGSVTVVAAGANPSGLAVLNYAAGASVDSGNPTDSSVSLAAVLIGKYDIVSLSANPWQIFR